MNYIIGTDWRKPMKNEEPKPKPLPVQVIKIVKDYVTTEDLPKGWRRNKRKNTLTGKIDDTSIKVVFEDDTKYKATLQYGEAITHFRNIVTKD